jgi:hypothetical protein
MSRLLQIIPSDGQRLYGAIVKKEVELYKKNRGTFYRSGTKQRDRAKWAHQKYKGWINLSRGVGEVVTAEVQSKSTQDDEWQILHAFLGWLDRHFSDQIKAINIQYR